MNLKTEQILLNDKITESEPKIYTTGAYLVPIKVIIQGKEKFLWVVDEFNDDTYLQGSLISPNIIANKRSELFEEI